MYRPTANVVDDEAAWQILADSRAGHLVTAAGGALDATFLPYVVDVEEGRASPISLAPTPSGAARPSPLRCS